MWWRGALVRRCCLRARGCALAHGGCEAGAVGSGSVVAAQGCEGGLCLVAVCHDEDCVYFVSVMVVVVLRVFDVGVHDAGGAVSALVGVFEVMPAVHVSHAAFVACDGERVAVVEGEGGGSYFVVADGNVGGVSTSENFRVFFRRAVLVEGDFVGVHGWFLLFLVCWLLCPRVVGGVRVAWVLLVVVEVAAAGLTIAGAGAVTVGALAVPVCGAAVAYCLVHSSCCAICTRACLHVWTRGWLVVPARLGVCL